MNYHEPKSGEKFHLMTSSFISQSINPIGACSLRLKMIVHVSNFDEIKARRPIDWVFVSMTLEIENNYYYKNTPRSCSVNKLLDIESPARIHLTLSLKYQAGQINWTILLGQKNPGSKTSTLGRSEYEGICITSIRVLLDHHTSTKEQCTSIVVLKLQIFQLHRRCFQRRRSIA